MSKVDLPLPRSIVTDDPDHLQIVIPVRTNWAIVIFLSVWLCGWVMGEVSVAKSLVSESSLGGTPQKQGAPIAFLTFWIIGWTIGGLGALAALLWNLTGKEVIELRRGELVTRREIVGWGRSREYDLSHVKNLRVVPPSNPAFRVIYPRTSFPWMGGGLISFDYGARTFTFGSGIDEPEANKLLEILQRRR